MSYGLKLWDHSGNLSLDTTSRITRWVGDYIGSFESTASNVWTTYYITLSIPNIVNDGTWGVFFSSKVNGLINGDPSAYIAWAGEINDFGNQANVTINSGYVTITWSSMAYTSGSSWISYRLSYTLSVFRY